MTVLIDVLAPGLNVVFCGTAAGNESARTRCYYAGPGNKFWRALHEIGLTPRQLSPSEYEDVLNYKIGLTDLVKNASGPDAGLAVSDYDVKGLKERLLAANPKFIAFNGKQAAAAFLGRKTSEFGVGITRMRHGESRIAVLPSTSGAASGYWSVLPWQDLAHAVNGRPVKAAEVAVSRRTA